MSAASPGAGPDGVDASAREPDPIHEEEALGKAYDTRLLQRLWRYVAPYRVQVVLTLLLVAPMFALELAPAWIIKTGLDHVIAPSAGAPRAGGEPGAALAWLLNAPAGLPALLWLAGLYLAAMVVNAGLSFVQTVLMATTGQSAMRDLRRDVFGHI